MAIMRWVGVVVALLWTCSIWADETAEYTYFKRQVASDTSHVDVHVNYQNLGLKKGDRTKLQKEYHTWMQSHPNSGMFLYLYGRLLETPQQQRVYFSRAIRADATLYLAQVDLGRLHYGLGEYAEAIARYQAALKLKPNSAGIANLLGLAYYHQGYPDQAITAYQQAIEANAHYGDAYLNLGLAYFFTNQTDAAIHTYEQAQTQVTWDGDEHLLYHNLGMAYRQKKLFDKARTAYLKALELKPDYDDVYVSLGNLAFEMGDYTAAVRAYEKVLGSNAETPDVFLRLGLAHYNQKAYAPAIVQLQAVLARDSTRSEVYDYLGRAYYFNDQLTLAETALKMYVEKEQRFDQRARVSDAKQLLLDIRKDRFTNLLK